MEESKDGIWAHLEDLRWMFFRIMIAIVLAMLVFFVILPHIFQALILGPSTSDFVLYQILCGLNEYILILPEFCNDNFRIDIININLSSQFLTHITTSIYLGFIFVFPYIIWELWRFLAPALYAHERKKLTLSFLLGASLFYCGIAVGYLFIFPITLRFLADYSISDSIINQISLDSYMSNLLFVVFSMGVVFELPVVLLSMSKLGILNKQRLKTGRRYAIVILLILAAVITPTGDPFTLLVVFTPLYVLYELSIYFVKE